MRALAALCATGGMLGALGGILFWAAHGGTALTRAVAYGCWFAAAVCLLAPPVVGSKRVWRATSLPVVEGWVFVSASVLLTALGAAIDAA